MQYDTALNVVPISIASIRFARMSACLLRRVVGISSTKGLILVSGLVEGINMSITALKHSTNKYFVRLGRHLGQVQNTDNQIRLFISGRHELFKQVP